MLLAVVHSQLALYSWLLVTVLGVILRRERGRWGRTGTAADGQETRGDGGDLDIDPHEASALLVARLPKATMLEDGSGGVILPCG